MKTTANTIQVVADFLEKEREDRAEVHQSDAKTTAQIAKATGLSVKDAREAAQYLASRGDVKADHNHNGHPTYRWRNTADKQHISNMKAMKWRATFVSTLLGAEDDASADYFSADDYAQNFSIARVSLERILLNPKLADEVLEILQFEPIPCIGGERVGEDCAEAAVFNVTNDVSSDRFVCPEHGRKWLDRHETLTRSRISVGSLRQHNEKLQAEREKKGEAS